MSDPLFYGDYFPEAKVPIRSKDCQNIKWGFVRNVIHNKERIRNSHTVLEKHLNKEQILIFYRNLYQKPDFDQSRLDQWLNFADRDVEDTVRKYTAIR